MEHALPSIVRLSGDWIGATEALYADAPTHEDWAAAVWSAVSGIIASDCVGLLAVRHTADLRSIVPILYTGSVRFPCFEGTNLSESSGLSASAVRRYFYPGRVVETLDRIEASLDAESRAVVGRWPVRGAYCGGLGVAVHPEPGIALVLFTFAQRPFSLGPGERKRLTQLGLHMETAFRLRLRPHAVRAILGPNGRLEHLAGSGVPDLWCALLGGELTVVRRMIGSRPHYYFLENPPHHASLRSLDRREVDVLSFVARGISSKAVAYSLGVSEGEVSRRLAAASSKLGLASRTELVRIAGILTQDPRAHFTDGDLTGAERQIIELLEMGLSNADIARLRSRSVRTVANQIALLLRKTGMGSRREFVARVGRGSA